MEATWAPGALTQLLAGGCSASDVLRSEPWPSWSPADRSPAAVPTGIWWPALPTSPSCSRSTSHSPLPRRVPRRCGRPAGCSSASAGSCPPVWPASSRSSPAQDLPSLSSRVPPGPRRRPAKTATGPNRTRPLCRVWTGPGPPPLQRRVRRRPRRARHVPSPARHPRGWSAPGRCPLDLPSSPPRHARSPRRRRASVPPTGRQRRWSCGPATRCGRSPRGGSAAGRRPPPWPRAGRGGGPPTAP